MRGTQGPYGSEDLFRERETFLSEVDDEFEPPTIGSTWKYLFSTSIRLQRGKPTRHNPVLKVGVNEDRKEVETNRNHPQYTGPVKRRDT